MQSVDGDIRLSAAITFNSKSLIDSSKDLQKSVENVFTSMDDSANKSTAMRSLEMQMDKATKKLDKMTKDFEELGKAKIPTQQLKDVEQSLAKAEHQANKTLKKLDELESNPKKKRTAMKSGRYDALVKEHEKNVRAVEVYAKRLEALEKSGNDYVPASTTKAYKDAAENLYRQVEAVSILMQRHDELEQRTRSSASGNKELEKSYKTLKRTGTNAIQKLTNVLRKMFGVIGKARLHFAQLFKHINKHSTFSLKKLVAYGLGIRSLYVLIRRLSTYATEAFKNLASQSTSFNTEMSSMMTGLVQLKGSLATAFQPIVSFVIPVINQLTAALNTCLNTIGSFFAALTGQKYIYKYTAAQQDFAGSLDDTGASAAKAKKSLMGFDELNTLSDNSSGGGGGGSGSDGTYEQVPIDPNSAVANFVKLLKESWKNGDFTEVGTIIGTKLKECLDSIPWNDIFDFSKRVGTSLGTFLTGFVTVPELADSIGRTVANAINTAMIGLDAFLTSTSWTDVGQFIADFANTAVRTFNWNLLGKTVADLLLAGINTWWTFVKEFDFSQLGTKISTAINTAFSTLSAKDENGLSGWSKLGQSISKSITGLLNTIITALKTINWSDVGTAIGELISNIDWKSVVWNLTELVSAFFSALAETLRSWKDTSPISAAIATVLLAAFATLKLAPILSAITNIFGSIGSKISAVMKASEGIGLAAGLTKEFPKIASVVGKITGLFTKVGSVISGAFTKVIPIITGIVSKLGTVLSTLGGKIYAALAGVVGGIQGFISWLGSIFMDFVGLIKNTLGFCAQHITAVGAGLMTSGIVVAISNFIDMLKGGFNWLSELGMMVGIALAAVGAVLAGFVTGPVAAIVGGIVAAVATLVIVVKDNWDAICDWTSNAIKNVKEAVTNGLNAIRTGWNNVWTSIFNFFKNLLNSIVQSVSTGMNNAKNTITNVINNIKSFWNNSFTAMKTSVANAFNAIRTTVTTVINAIRTGVSNGLLNIKTAWTNVLNAIKTATTNIFNGILTTIKKVINGIIGGINGMIKGIVSGINGIIRVLNKLSFKIPDWVPEMGGKKFGFNLSTVSAPQIPYLAKGAVIPPNKEFMAVLGDQKHGTNIEAPLDTIKQAVAEELGEYIDAMMAGFEAVVQAVNNKDLNVNIGDSAIGRAAERYNKRQSLVRGTL